jgi:hypothetical protein
VCGPWVLLRCFCSNGSPKKSMTKGFVLSRIGLCLPDAGRPASNRFEFEFDFDRPMSFLTPDPLLISHESTGGAALSRRRRRTLQSHPAASNVSCVRVAFRLDFFLPAPLIQPPRARRDGATMVLWSLIKRVPGGEGTKVRARS